MSIQLSQYKIQCLFLLALLLPALFAALFSGLFLL
jgi:hypothetical protein